MAKKSWREATMEYLDAFERAVGPEGGVIPPRPPIPMPEFVMPVRKVTRAELEREFPKPDEN